MFVARVLVVGCASLMGGAVRVSQHLTVSRDTQTAGKTLDEKLTEAHEEVKKVLNNLSVASYPLEAMPTAGTTWAGYNEDAKPWALAVFLHHMVGSLKEVAGAMDKASRNSLQSSGATLLQAQQQVKADIVAANGKAQALRAFAEKAKSYIYARIAAHPDSNFVDTARAFGSVTELINIGCNTVGLSSAVLAAGAVQAADAAVNDSGKTAGTADAKAKLVSASLSVGFDLGTRTDIEAAALRRGFSRACGATCDSICVKNELKFCV